MATKRKRSSTVWKTGCHHTAEDHARSRERIRGFHEARAQGKAPPLLTPGERRMRTAFQRELDARLPPDPRDDRRTTESHDGQQYTFRDLRRMRLALERLAQTTGRTMDELIALLDRDHDDGDTDDAVPR